MTFDEWADNNNLSAYGKACSICAWTAAQRAKREKYQELIGAAQDVLACYIYEHDETGSFAEFERLRISLESVKEKPE